MPGTRDYPGVTFERYADDAVVHCITEPQTRDLVAAIGNRMKQVRLRLHRGKTKVVYCQDGKRRLDRELTAFTFLGLTFGARPARTPRPKLFLSFQLAISEDARRTRPSGLRLWVDENKGRDNNGATRVRGLGTPRSAR